MKIKFFYLQLLVLSLFIILSLISCQNPTSDWKYIFPINSQYDYVYFSPEGIFTGGLFYGKSIYLHRKDSQTGLFSDTPKQIDLPDKLGIWKICANGSDAWVIASDENDNQALLKYNSEKEVWQNKTSDFDATITSCKKLSDGKIFLFTDKRDVFIVDHEHIQGFSKNLRGEIENITNRSLGGFWILNRDGFLSSLVEDHLTQYGYIQKKASFFIETQPEELWILSDKKIEEWRINEGATNLTQGLSFENKNSTLAVGVYQLNTSLLVVWSNSIWIINEQVQKKVDLPKDVNSIESSDFDLLTHTLVVSTNTGVYEKIFP